ncbi:MAG: MFS transporter [Lachnospiraceae bacterium]|nr:MFS transporter [Lachnospiraceae bacterium]
MANKTNYKEVLKDNNYKKLLASNLINRFGDSIDAIAFTWLVYDITKSASWAAIIYGLNVLPNIFLQPFLGAYVERLDKKKVVVATHIIRTLIISLFVIMYLNSLVTPYVMVAFTLIITSVESFNLPASSAFVQSILKKENVTHALSLSESLSSAMTLLGTALAGVIIAKFGVQTAMFIDAVTFLIAGILTFTIRPERKKPELAAVNETDKKESYIVLLKGGFKYIINNKIFVNYLIVAVIVNFLAVPLNALQAPIADDLYKLGSELLSVMGIGGSRGAILGSIILPKVMEKLSAKAILVVNGAIVGIGMFILSLGGLLKGAKIPGFLLAVFCFLLMMTAISLLKGSLNVQFMKMTDPDYMARASSVFGASCTAAMPVASFIVSAVALKLSTALLVGACGLLSVLVFLIVAISRMQFEDKTLEIKGEELDAA